LAIGASLVLWGILTWYHLLSAGDRSMIMRLLPQPEAK